MRGCRARLCCAPTSAEENVMSGSTTFNYTGSIVTYAVPADGVYDIVAYGA
jgi:hypothetical protein